MVNAGRSEPKLWKMDSNCGITKIKRIDETMTATAIPIQSSRNGLESVTTGRNANESWSETGNMPENVASEIHSSIMRACIPVAVLLSREVRLPPPLPLPNIQVKGKGAKKRPRPEGIEVA